MSKKDKEFNEIFTRLRNVENNRIKDETELRQLITMNREFIDTFNSHDEKEMQKYDKYDEHLMELKSTLQDQNNLLNNVKDSQAESKDSLEKVVKDMHATEAALHKELASVRKDLGEDIRTLDERTEESLKILFKYLYKGLGIAGIVILTATILVWGYGVMQERVEAEKDRFKTERDKNSALELRINKLAERQAITYGKLKMVLPPVSSQ